MANRKMRLEWHRNAEILRQYADQIASGQLLIDEFTVNLTPSGPTKTDGTMVMDAVEIIIKARTQ